jgi:hypothetical protein
MDLPDALFLDLLLTDVVDSSCGAHDFGVGFGSPLTLSKFD